jgi:hypothetical protein
MIARVGRRSYDAMSNSLCKPAALLLCAVPCMSPAQAAEHTLLKDQLVTTTRVANLLDADYETAQGFNQPGQAVYLSLRYQAL